MRHSKLQLRILMSMAAAIIGLQMAFDRVAPWHITAIFAIVGFGAGYASGLVSGAVYRAPGGGA